MSPNITISKLHNSRKQNKELLYNIFLWVVTFLVIIAILLLIIQPTKYMGSIQSGLDLFFVSVLPSLLPFLFLTKILSGIGAINKLSYIFKPLINWLKLPACTAFIMLSSFICGYPLGVKLIGEMVKKGSLSCKDAKRIVPLATTSGPIFVIGAVGASMFNNSRLGIIIFTVHILSSFITGCLFCICTKSKTTQTNIQNSVFTSAFTLEETTISTFNSVLMVAVYVSIFYMFIDMAYDLNLLSFLSDIMGKGLRFLKLEPACYNAISSSIIEMTRGLKDLSVVNNDAIKLILSSSAISFGGISIFMQSLSFLSGTKISPLYFLFVKLVQTLITIITSIIFALIFL